MTDCADCISLYKLYLQKLPIIEPKRTAAVFIPKSHTKYLIISFYEYAFIFCFTCTFMACSDLSEDWLFLQ